MRFLLALARAQAVTTAIGLCAGAVLADWLLGAHLLSLPFLQDAVAAGRVFPALAAGSGAVVVASDWGDHEGTGARPPVVLGAGRWTAGAAVVCISSLAVAANLSVVALLYVLLGVLATVLPRVWWLALPALLYMQLYVPADLLPR